MAFGSPTYMGGPAAQFKAFADATGDRWAARTWANKVAGRSSRRCRLLLRSGSEPATVRVSADKQPNKDQLDAQPGLVHIPGVRHGPP